MLKLLLSFLALIPGFVMVKENDFKKCSQSSFCVRQRALADLVDVKEGPQQGWKLGSLKFGKESISAVVSSSEQNQELVASFTLLNGRLLHLNF